MLNRKRNILIGIFCMTFCWLLSINTLAAQRVDNENFLYRAFLSKKTVKIMANQKRSIPLQKVYFTVVDIDGNGVKELIVKVGCRSKYGPCAPNAYIFTIKNNKIVYSGMTCLKQDNSATVQISKKYKSIFSCYPVASYLSAHFYTLKNGKLSDKKYFYRQNGYPNGKIDGLPHESWCKKMGYYINKKKVSQKKYTTEYEKYRKSLKKYKLYKNIALNREKYLK